MQTLYKLTDENNQTYNKTQWGPNVTHSGTGKGELCGPGYIHAYTHPLLAVLLNPIHADFKNPKLWKAQGTVVKNDNGLKVGCVSLTTIEKLELPKVTTEQRVKFAILCAKAVCKDKDFNSWADKWLSGEDRTEAAAEAATWAAWAWAAAEAAAWAAAKTARTAAEAAWAAAKTARTAEINLEKLAEEACA